MTEFPQETRTGQGSSDERPTFVDQPPADFVLQAVVGLANDVGVGMGVTLCVGGVIVSGEIVPGKTYFEGIAKEALQASGPADQTAIRQSISDYLGNFGKLLYDPDKDEENATESAKPLPSYIHLKNTRFFHNSGKPMPHNKGLWWRGRLTAVDGFSFGVMVASE